VRARPLGPDAPAVSVIGFGVMALSIAGRPADSAVGPRVIHAALDHGVTLLDTANVYCRDDADLGYGERLVADALRTWSGQAADIVVATKGGMRRPRGQWTRDGRPAELRAACEQSLRALGRDRIDLYQLHTPDIAVPLADSVGALVDLQAAGKIRWIGLSNVSLAELTTAMGIATITAVQNRLNPFFRESPRDGVAARCADRGLGFLAYSPLGGGRLCRTLPDHPVLQSIAARHRVSPHAVTLAWVCAQADSVIALPSARTVEHALDSLSAATLELSNDELAAISAAEFSRA
jgi:aryl-alcohol dehydrogenase-like predicted oxidoreductase